MRYPIQIKRVQGQSVGAQVGLPLWLGLQVRDDVSWDATITDDGILLVPTDAATRPMSMGDVTKDGRPISTPDQDIARMLNG